MACTEIVILTTKSRDSAGDALRELKRLDREGWVDLVCYALVDEDAKGNRRMRETSDCAEAIGLARSNGGLQPGASALMVVVEQSYAERVSEEFETRGTTQRRPMRKSQCEAALRASIEAVKSKIVWLEELLEHEAEKAAWVYGGEKERLEAGIRAGRTELAIYRVHLQARLQALRSELETRLVRGVRRAKKGAAGAVPGADSEELEREIADINEDLALSISDHLDALAAHAAELREKATRSDGGTSAAIQEQLDEFDLHMRKYRADLTATLAASASLARHCTERLRENGLEAAMQSHAKRLEQRHALLKADIERLQTEGTLSRSGESREKAMGGYQ